MSPLTVETLLEAVQHLPPLEFRRFEEGLARLRLDAASDEQLLEAVRQSLPPAEAGQLRELIARSEAGTLSDPERAAYRELAERAEHINLARVRAVAELARRWGMPLDAVLHKVGWEQASHDA